MAKPRPVMRIPGVVAVRSKQANSHNVWECSVCNLQFVGGPRCPIGNPTPEEREAHPERYVRLKIATAAKANSKRGDQDAKDRQAVDELRQAEDDEEER